MENHSLRFYMIRSELEDAVGVENVSTQEMERAVYSVDYFWLSRKWQDAGQKGVPCRTLLSAPAPRKRFPRF